MKWTWFKRRKRRLSDVLRDVENERPIHDEEAGGRTVSDCFESLPGGLVVPVKDAGALAEAALFLAKRRELRERMGKRNRQIVLEEYEWDDNAEKLLEIYKKLKRDRE